MKLLGLLLLAATSLLGYLRFTDLSLWSAGIGVAFSAALFTLLTAFKTEKPAPDQNHPQNSLWEGRFHELQAQAAENMEGLNREVQKLQQKLIRADERCLSYQKLVEVHQNEIDKLKIESAQLGEQVIEKDRKLSELQLARIEPDLFDAEKRQMESSYREFKKQFEEKSAALDQARIRLFRVESDLLALQKEKEEQKLSLNPTENKLIDQLKQTEEEKKKLESELLSLQQLVSELSKNSIKPSRSAENEEIDLLEFDNDSN